MFLEKERNETGNTHLLRLRKIGENEDWESKLLQYAVPIIIEAIDVLAAIKIQEEKCFDFDNKHKEGEVRLKLGLYPIYCKVRHILGYVREFLMNKLISSLS